jgi:hypothetical protein
VHRGGRSGRHRRAGNGTGGGDGPVKLLIAPITITATKPILPTHAKGFLWADVLAKSTELVADVTFLWNTRSANLTGQTLRFWEYLDRTTPDLDFGECSGQRLGELYVASHTAPEPPPYSALRSYAERVERDGWTHPASSRIFRLWAEQLGLLNVRDPGFFDDRPHPISVEEAVESLRARSLCLDHRPYGGPAYLDGTRWGMPLRKVISEAGQPNYVLMVLRDLLTQHRGYDHVLLVHDEEIAPDFALIERILQDDGAATSRLPLGRVGIEGVVRSSREGGWAGSTLGDLTEICRERVTLDGLRLGMRIYFIAMLQRSSGPSLRPDLLARAMTRAERVLANADDTTLTEGLLRPFLTDAGWVDPYRLTNSVLSKERRAVSHGLLRKAFL